MFQVIDTYPRPISVRGHEFQPYASLADPETKQEIHIVNNDKCWCPITKGGDGNWYVLCFLPASMFPVIDHIVHVMGSPEISWPPDKRGDKPVPEGVKS
jgi:hypothetical protein